MAFVGRTQTLARLHAVIEDALRGHTRLVLVSGEAGIGKTALISAATAHAGLPVGWGTCAGAERAPAFWPWTAALRRLLGALDMTDAHALTRTDTTELARLLPELADAATAPTMPADADMARLRLFDAFARFLERLAQHRAAVVVLDDLQWADESSLHLLSFIALPYRPVPLVIIGAYRHDELSPGTARSLAELAAHGEPVHLTGLAQQDVYDLVADAAGTPTATLGRGDPPAYRGPPLLRSPTCGAAPGRRRASRGGACCGS